MEKNVKIKKVLNNNVVIAQNDNEETILMGLGLGFGKKAGEVVEDKKIEKIFDKIKNFHSISPHIWRYLCLILKQKQKQKPNPPV